MFTWFSLKENHTSLLLPDHSNGENALNPSSIGFVIRHAGCPSFKAFSRTLSPPPAPDAKTPKIFLVSASGNVRNLDLRHVTILYTAPPPPRPTAIPAFAGQKSSPTPPQTQRPRRAPRIGSLRPPGADLVRLVRLVRTFFQNLSRPVGPHIPAQPRRTGQPARRASRGARPISSGGAADT